MARNLELLKQTWEFIKKNPEMHNQADFINNTQCGTTMCFAGHATVLSGAEFPKEPNDSYWFLTPDGKLTEKDENGARKGIYVEKYARDVLGMTDEEAQFIFYHTSNYGFAEKIEYLIELWERGESYGGYDYDDSYEDDYDGPCHCCDYDEEDDSYDCE